MTQIAKHLLLISLCMSTAYIHLAEAQEISRPNIIFVLADDLGWSSLSIPMQVSLPDSRSDYHQTPNLAELARQGMRFSRGYSPASICSPSRRSILFGHTPARQGDVSFAKSYYPGRTRYETIPQVLKKIDQRYTAAHFGKWDMRAGFTPKQAGFDQSDGDTGNRDGDVMTSRDNKWSTHFLVDDPKGMFSMTDRAMNFMREQVGLEKPFYLQVSHYATHVDLQSRRETYQKYRQKSQGVKHGDPAFAAMLEDLDSSIGQLLKAVDDLGIAGNTFIFFMADNGATEFLPPVKNRLDPPSAFAQPMRNAPLRGGKWTLYEGGIRVPFIVKGPGISAGSQCDVPVAGWDLLPTFARIAGSDFNNHDYDGGNFYHLLQGDANAFVSRADDAFYFHRYNNAYPHSAIIEGDFKAIVFWKTGKIELYNLRLDPGEAKDLASADPQRTKELSGRLTDYLNEVNPGLIASYTK